MSTGKEIVGIVKEAPKVLESIYSDLAQPGIRKVGIALETVLEFSTSFLLPVKLLNEKIKLNFEKRLNEYKDKINSIPDEDLCEVNPQIGTPLLDKLTYTTNDEIADLFINLLTKASSKKTTNLAHPSFVQMIERLSVDECRIIKYLNNKEYIPCVSFRAYFKEDKGFNEIVKKGTEIQSKVDLLFPNNINTYLDNLVSMGVLDASHGLHKIDTSIYEPLYKFYNFTVLSENLTKIGLFSKVEKKNSFYQITDFGKSFIKACTHGKNEN